MSQRGGARSGSSKRKPMSGKQKKEMLQEKRERNRQKRKEEADAEDHRRRKFESSSSGEEEEDGDSIQPQSPIEKVEVTALGRVKKSGTKGADERTYFQVESKEEIEKRKAISRKPIVRKEIEENIIGVRSSLDEISKWENMGDQVTMPWRVNWNSLWTKEELEKAEEREFKKWLSDLNETYGQSRLNAFEHNLEVWRQLWRTLEMSDVVAIVVDVRYPAFLFPFPLYKHVIQKISKPCLMILNKVDIVSKEHVEEWKRYFQAKFPELKIVTFTSHAEPEKKKKTKHKAEDTESSSDSDKSDEEKDLLSKMQHRRKKKSSKRRLVSVGVNDLLGAFQEALISSKPDESDNISRCFDFSSKKSLPEDAESGGDASNEYSVTIGLVGQPNAGKSSIINGILNRSAVSVSRTPGHTKHFQTIYLNRLRRGPDEWGWGLKLCDSPGLVFPLVDVSRTLQIVCGLFPLAQVKEPYSAVHFIGEHTPVPLNRIYKLRVPDEDDDLLSNDDPEKYPWSGWSICVSYALHRGFKTARAGRPDVYRAANFILKDVVDGKVVVAFLPPHSENEGAKFVSDQIPVE